MLVNYLKLTLTRVPMAELSLQM